MRDVFEFRERLIDEYKSFSGSFTKIAAPDIRAEVERQYALGRYWPEPLVQINPNFEQAETVQQLVQMGILQRLRQDLSTLPTCRARTTPPRSSTCTKTRSCANSAGIPHPAPGAGRLGCTGVAQVMDVRFGFLFEPTELVWQAGRIEVLPDHAETVEAIRQNERVYDGWLYPPLSALPRTGREAKEPPAMPVAFSLPATHRLHLLGEGWSNADADFFIALFGLLKGMRLQRACWQHFFKAPLNSQLADFHASNPEITRALDGATTFWRGHNQPEVRNSAFAALHWHLFAQLYAHEFERFSFQYIALDACAEWALQMAFPGYPKKRPHHSHRVAKLCEATGVPIPNWALQRNGRKTCAVAERRNALVHQALYAGQPIGGFAFPEEQPEMELELTGLVARLFLGLLGIDNEYTRSSCTEMQIIGFSFSE